ncbi:MAG: amidohydrolase family protein, partial [Gemmatimonadetes bacterium]|nr:amidohydrolase family protein [Gemmatimonadota bacterium]
MRNTLAAASVTLLHVGLLPAQTPSLSPSVREFVSVDAPVIALTHVKVIDGTGAPPADDQTVVIQSGKIQAIGSSARVQAPAGARVMDLRGHTVIPGLVGMHNHTFYTTLSRTAQLGFSAPRLYLASGVTTIRATGSYAPYNDLNLKRAIDQGEAPGPRMHTTGPYITGPAPDPVVWPELIRVMHPVPTPEDARRVVAYWAEEGVTWFKAYTQITRAALGAA